MCYYPVTIRKSPNGERKSSNSMNLHPVIIQIATLLAATIPCSLLLIRSFEKIFIKYNPKVSSTTTICTSVTGTLTKNIITVKSLLFGKFEGETKNNSQLVHLEDKESKEEMRVEKKLLKPHDAIQMMATIVKVCSHSKHPKTEEVMSIFFKQCYLNLNQLAEKYVKVQEIESTSDKKFTSIVVSSKENYEHFTFSKGNPYDLLEKCTRMLVHGRKVDIDYALRRKLKDKIKKLNRQGEKVIAFAYKALPLKRLGHYTEDFAEKEMIFLGFLGLGDSINKDLIPVIEEIKEQGIKTYVLTSIRERNAVAIGQNLSITSKKYFQGVTSVNLAHLNDQKLKKMLANRDKDFVFAEMTPDDKKRIITALTEIGETVVFLEHRNKDSLKNLIRNIQKGRQSRLNYQKLNNHAISSKIAELILVFAAIIFQAPLTLTIGLILLIDISTNTFLELGLQKESIDTAHKPRSTHQLFQKRSIVVGLIFGCSLAWIAFWNLTRFGWQPGEAIANHEMAFISTSTILFILLTSFQILHAFIINRGSPLNNVYLMLTATVSILATLFVILFEPIQDFFNLQLPTTFDWQIIGFSSFVILILLLIWKSIFQRKATSA
jgi:magnesium-transporting ATPase (P-type)